jgi:hypothetical protein
MNKFRAYPGYAPSRNPQPASRNRREAATLPAPFFFGAVVFGITAPCVQRRQNLVAATQRRPDRVVYVEPDFVLAFALAIRFAAKMRQIGDPNDAIQRHVLVINQDDR